MPEKFEKLPEKEIPGLSKEREKEILALPDEEFRKFCLSHFQEMFRILILKEQRLSQKQIDEIVKRYDEFFGSISIKKKFENLSFYEQSKIKKEAYQLADLAINLSKFISKFKNLLKSANVEIEESDIENIKLTLNIYKDNPDVAETVLWEIESPLRDNPCLIKPLEAEEIKKRTKIICDFYKKEDVVKTIQLYEKINPPIAKSIASELGDFALDEKRAIEAINFYQNPEVIKLIRELKDGEELIYYFTHQIFYLKDAGMVLELLNFSQSFKDKSKLFKKINENFSFIAQGIKNIEDKRLILREVIKTLQNYQRPETIAMITEVLGFVVWEIKDTKDSKKIEKVLNVLKRILQCYQRPEIFETIRLFEEKHQETSPLKEQSPLEKITYSLGSIARFKHLETSISAAEAVQVFKEKPDIASIIAESLKNISVNVEDPETVLETISDILSFRKDTNKAVAMARLLESASETKNDGIVIDCGEKMKKFLVFCKDINSHDLKRLIQTRFWESDISLEGLNKEGDFSEKIKRIMLYINLRELGLKIKDPDLTGEWIEKIVKMANEKVKEKFKIKRELSLNESLALLQAKVEKEEIEMIQELANSKIEKSFPLDKIYEKIEVLKLKEKGDPTEITKSLVNFLLTTESRAKKDVPKHYKRLKEVLRFFSPEKLRAARNLIRRREPNKIFSQIKEDFKLLTKESNEEAAQKIREYFKELAKKELEGKTPKDAEALSDLIDAIESIGKARVFETLLIKTEKGDLTDLTDNRTLSCCAFYPDGANKEASIYYLKDPEIGLLWIKSATYQGEELDNLGVAIMVNCQDKEGNKVLLIDSVEGGEALERSGIEWKEKMLESIKKIAEENKQKYIVFNLNVTNETPKRFNRFLGEKKIKEGKIYLEKINGVEAIKEWNDKHYLEAFGGWQFPKGGVKGYKIEVEKEK